MTTSNLATETETLFRRISEAAQPASPQTSISVLQIWRIVFQQTGKDIDDTAFLRSLAVIRSRLERLSEQVSRSTTMDNNQKNFVHGVINGLKMLTPIDALPINIFDLRQHVSLDKIAILGLLSGKLENAELTLSDDDAAQIANELDELGSFVSNADIEADLKKLLLHHVAYMAWAVRNISIVGAEGVYEAFGPALLNARQAARSDSEAQDTLGEPPRRRIFGWIVEIAQKTIKLLEFTDKSIQLIDHIENDIRGLLP